MADQAYDLFERFIENYSPDQLAKGMAAPVKQVADSINKGFAEQLKDRANEAKEMKAMLKEQVKEMSKELIDKDDVKEITKYLQEVRNFLKEMKDKQNKMPLAKGGGDFGTMAEKALNKKTGGSMASNIDKFVKAATSGHSLHVHDYKVWQILSDIARKMGATITAVTRESRAANRTLYAPTTRGTTTTGSHPDAGSHPVLGSHPDAGSHPVIGGGTSIDDSARKEVAKMSKGSLRQLMRHSGGGELHEQIQELYGAYQSLEGVGKRHLKDIKLIRGDWVGIKESIRKSAQFTTEQVDKLGFVIAQSKDLNIIDRSRLLLKIKQLNADKDNVEKQKELIRLSGKYADKLQGGGGGRLASAGGMLAEGGRKLFDLPKFSFIDLFVKGLNSGAKYTKDISKTLYQIYGLTGDVGDEANSLKNDYHAVGQEILDAYIETGQTDEVFRKSYLKNLGRGIGLLSKTAKITKSGLATATLIDSEAESTSDMFADWSLHLRQSAGEMAIFGRNLQFVQRMTNLSGDRLVEAAKSVQQLAQQMKFAGMHTAEIEKHLIAIQAVSKSKGLENAFTKLTLPLLTPGGFNKAGGPEQAFIANMLAKSGRPELLAKVQRGGILDRGEQKAVARGGLNFLKVLEAAGLPPETLEMIVKEAFGVGFGEARIYLTEWDKSLETATERLKRLTEEYSTGIKTEQEKKELNREIAKANEDIIREANTKKMAELVETRKKLGGMSPEEGKAFAQANAATMRPTLDAMFESANQALDDSMRDVGDTLKNKGDEKANLEKMIKDGVSEIEKTGILKQITGIDLQLQGALNAVGGLQAKREALNKAKGNLGNITDPAKMAAAIDEAMAASEMGDVRNMMKNLGVLSKAEDYQVMIQLRIQQAVETIANKFVKMAGAEKAVAANIVIGGLEDAKKLFEMLPSYLKDLATAAGIAGAGFLAAAGPLAIFTAGAIAIGVAAWELKKALGELADATDAANRTTQQSRTAAQTGQKKWDERFGTTPEKMNESIQSLEKQLAQQQMNYKSRKANQSFGDRVFGDSDAVALWNAMGDTETRLQEAKAKLKEMQSLKSNFVGPPEPTYTYTPTTTTGKPMGPPKPDMWEGGKVPDSVWKEWEEYLNNSTKPGSIYTHDVHVESVLKKQQATTAASPTNEAVQTTAQSMTEVAQNTAETNRWLMMISESLDAMARPPSGATPGNTASNSKPKTPANWWSWAVAVMGGIPAVGGANAVTPG